MIRVNVGPNQSELGRQFELPFKQLQGVAGRVLHGLVAVDEAEVVGENRLYVLSQDGFFGRRVGNLVLDSHYEENTGTNEWTVVNNEPVISYFLKRRGLAFYEVYCRTAGKWVASELPEPLPMNEAIGREWIADANKHGLVTVISEGTVISRGLTPEKLDLFKRAAVAARLTAIQHGIITNPIPYNNHKH